MTTSKSNPSDLTLDDLLADNHDAQRILQQAIATQAKPGFQQSSFPSQPIVLQEFVPVSESIESQLSNWHWQHDGTSSFVEGQVPYIINNSGRLSLQTANLLFAYFQWTDSPDQHYTLLELGAGTGLFARYLLDHLKRLCIQQDKDYYQRITFYVTDYAETNLLEWQALGLFEEHKQQVQLATCDASIPQLLKLLSGEQVRLNGVNFVFSNYMLGVLPAAMLKQVNDEWQELLIATNILPDSIHPELRPVLTEVEQIIANGGCVPVELLGQLETALDIQTKYVPLRNSLATYLDTLPEGTQDNDRFLLNYGAIESIEAILDILHPQGAILVNDFGPTLPEHIQDFAAFTRFGATTASGLNFLHLTPYFTLRGTGLMVPEHTEKASVQSRLVMGSDCVEMNQYFQQFFGLQSELYYHQPIDDARQYLKTDNHQLALESYQKALQLNPYDWAVIAEIADFLIMQVEDFEAGTSLAKQALKINPWYSAWAWNVLGDGFYCLDKLPEAHRAYLRAEGIYGKDPRTQLNLAYSYLRRQEYSKALQAIAIGLANDVEGEFRLKLLEKQQQVLASISEQYQRKQTQLDRRNSKLCE